MRFAPPLAVAVVAAVACGDDRPGPSDTIADHVRADPRFDQLEDALRAADLLDDLDTEDPHTLFAPTDAAFDAFYAARGLDRAALFGLDDLEALVGHHVVGGELTVADLERRTALAPLAGPEIHVRAGLDGIALDDETRIVAIPIEASNGVIHVLDAVLARPLIAPARRFEMQLDLPLTEPTPEDPFGSTASSLVVDDQGLIHDLQVAVDIEHDDVSGLFIFLEHVESGAFHPLIRRPGSNGDDLRVTFADSAPLDAADDVSSREAVDDEPAFPEPAYRPFETLELFVGDDIAGEWRLHVFNLRPESNGTLVSWGLIASYGSEPPAAAIAFGRGASSLVFARGFNESASAVIHRVGGLEGAVELGAAAGSLVAEPRTIDETQRVGSVVLPIAADADLGQRDLVLSARSGEVSRIRHLDLEVVEPDAEGIELVAHVPLADLGAGGLRGNDLWGWTDPETGIEYALVGTSSGTAFVDLGDPSQPVVVGVLPTHTETSDWRDIKVFADHAFIVSEAPAHGLQVFDLRQLRGAMPGQVFAETAHLADFGNAHNIVIDEQSGFAYVVGATEDYPAVCSGGLLMIDINTPAQPSVAGCFAGAVPAGQEPGPGFPTDAYVHDAQCVVYAGPDADHQGRQICISSDGQVTNNANYLAIADVTDKSAVAQIARVTYAGAGYAHQGWLTEDHRYFILNDEFDEFVTGQTRSYVFDLSDLDAPVLHGVFDNPRDAVGHNTYIAGNVAYQANYTSGLRLIDVSGVETMELSEIAYFDTFPRDDGDDDGIALRCGRLGVLPHPDQSPEESGCGREQSFRGAWSNYPFFASGIIAVSDIDRGLFLLRPTVALP